MTTSKQSLAHDLNDTTGGMTHDEFNHFKQKLESSVQSKVASGELKFSMLQEVDESPNPTTIDLSLYGLKNSDDLRIFLLSPAGETVTDELAAEIASEEALQEEQRRQAQEQIILEERKRGLLFHWLLEEEEEAKEAQKELIALQNEKTLKEEQNAQQKGAPQSETTAKESFTETITRLEKDQENLIDRERKLYEEKQAIEEKYDTCEKSLDQFDSEKFEKKSEDELETEIEALQRKADGLADQISVEGNDKKARQLGNELSALSLEIASLQDIRDKQKGEKVFVDENGNNKDATGQTITYNKAAFVLSKDQQIIKDTDGQHYLLEKGQQWDTIKDNPKEKNDAKQNYERSKNNIKVVKEVVQDIKKEAIGYNATRIGVNKAEQLMVKNQISLMQSARAQQTLQQKANPDLSMHAPQSTITGANQSLNTIQMPSGTSSKMGSSSKLSLPVMTASAFVKTELNEQGQNKKPTWNNVFDIINKIPDKNAKEAAKNLVNKAIEQFKKELNLSDVPRMSPIPDETMKSLLANMERFTVNAYAVGPEVPPQESKSAKL